jgi:hypothetical protein
VKIKSFILPAVFIFLCVGIGALYAVEKGGLRVEISKRTTSNQDKNTDFGEKRIDRNMSLKIDVTNTSMHDMPATSVDYVVLIRKPYYSYSDGTSNIWRYQGTVPLKQLLASEGTSILLGDFHIGGWQYGNSSQGMDKLEAWKVVITRDNQKLEFVSSSSFDSVDKHAKDAPKSKE